MGGGLKGERRELEVLDFAGVHKVDDAPAVQGVAGQPVWMPSENARRFPSLDPVEHVVEDRASWSLGRNLLHQHVHYFQAVFAGKVMKLGNLVADGADLM